MSEIIEAVPQEIFQQPLNNAEQEMVEALVAQHKNNVVVTQQLAMDASRLFTCSEERLKQQIESGFFKRFSGALSGQNREQQLQNQVDVLQMQKFAWHYLQQLQQQNLINAQSIAVIRNNLGTMNEYIIETREFLFQAVDKINRRLIRVENHASFNQWSLNIEANKRRFRSMPKALLILNLSYDFLRSHPSVMLTSQDINHLIVTLEKLEVDCDQEVKLLDFILDLIDQIEASSIERYRSLIELSYGDHLADSYFIQKNISGLAFNSLYYLSDEYDRVIDLLSDIEVCDTDEKRERIVSRFFGREFSGLETRYCMRDLIEEIIGGSLLTLEIYKAVNGVDTVSNNSIEDTEPVTLISQLPDINDHTFFDNTEDKEAHYNYLRLFSLCIDSFASLNKEGQAFIELLANKAGCPQVMTEVAALANSPNKVQDNLAILKELLKNDDSAYIWLLDAFYLLTLCNTQIESPNMLRILNSLKPAQFREHFPYMLTVISEQDEEKVLAAAEKLQHKTNGWRNVIGYREFNFEKVFSDLRSKLRRTSSMAQDISLELAIATMKSGEYSCFMDMLDDSFMGRIGSKVGSAAYTLGRSSCLSSLNDVRKKVSKFISEHAGVLQQGNRELVRWGIPAITFESDSGHGDFELDNSTENEEWYEQFCHFERQLDNTLTSFSNACTEVSEQLEFFIKGRFGESVIELREKQRAEQLEQQRQEKLAKQSVIVKKDDIKYLLRIEWNQIKHPPCDPEKITSIKTDGTTWLIVANGNGLYRSLDRENWMKVELSKSENAPYISKLFLVNGMWIAFAGYSEGFYYSQDSINWKQSLYPDGLGYNFTKTENIVYFNGLWLWRFTVRKEYKYVEKGIFLDSTKTSTYDGVFVFCSERLDGGWREWKLLPNLSEGIKVESLQPLPSGNTLLAFCHYDYFYTKSKKKNNVSSSIRYYIDGKGWRHCTWDGKNDQFGEPVIINVGHKMLCFYRNQVISSDKKGYEWHAKTENIDLNDYAHLKDFTLFIEDGWKKTLYVSQSGESFDELFLGEGNWHNLAANEQGLLAVYSRSSHEKFLKSGSYIFTPIG
ncbi:hypothetical protein ACFOEE_18365 [Pseudoalteromonas fenneropenaei]|uniref:Uncharacterized protein n=1 Tax=Pseudoalteromonas fenneropenaei TaxID=1737459 RepID=A0ABV7CPI4_9GAMM